MTRTRVALFGNVANNLLAARAAIAANPAFEADLFVDSRDHPATRPESEDARLAEAPHWLHRGPWVTPSTMLAPWRTELTRRLATYDVVIVSGAGPMYAQFTGRPWCFYPTGGDLTQMPFFWRFLDLYPGWRRKLGFAMTGLWQRRAVRRAQVIWTSPFRPLELALGRLGIPTEKIGRTYVPVLIDTERFKPRPVTAGSSAAQLRSESDFIVFHPSRLMIDDRPKQVETGNWKNNDALIRGFARFVQSQLTDTPLLVMPEREASPDLRRAKQLIDELGIGESVRWITSGRPEGFTRDELGEFYAAADVVGDNFGVGWFGGVTLEGMAFAKPVLGAVDDRAMTALYPHHPIQRAGDEDEVFARLSELAGDRDHLIRVGSESRRWVERFHSIDLAGDIWTRALEEALSTRTPRSGRAA